MCNSIQTRAKYCPKPCKPSSIDFIPGLLLINTIRLAGGSSPGGSDTTATDTMMFLYKTSTLTPSFVGDDIDNDPGIDNGIPQNFNLYDNSLYQDVYLFEYSSIDIDLNTMNVG